MDNTAIAVTIISSIISGVLATWISNDHYKKMLVKEQKTQFVQELFGYRYQLGETNQYGSKELVHLFAQIPMIFNDNKKVMDLYKEILSKATDDLYISLMKELCRDKHVKVDIENWNDSLIMKTLMV